MKILLVQPSQKFILGKRKLKGSIMPPLGPLTLAALVREHLPKAIIHFADYEAKNGELKPDLGNYDIIGISGTTVHFPHAIFLAKQAKTKNKDTCILLVGHMPLFVMMIF